jgi:hypothetical protein
MSRSVQGKATPKIQPRSDAEVAARDLLARFPDQPDGWDRLGMVYEARGENQKAAEAYRKVIEYIRLAWRPKRRCRAFLLNQEHRQNLAGRVVHCHDQVKLGLSLKLGVPRPQIKKNLDG